MTAEIGVTHSYEPTHLVVVPGVDWDDWMEIWATVRETHRNAPWWCGDALLAARREFGEERWAQAVNGHAVDFYRGAMWVCEKIEPPRRREAVSFSSHKAIAALPPDEQDRWLLRVEENDWTVKQLNDELKAEKARLNGGYPSNGPSEPNGSVPHGMQQDIDIKPETRRNSSTEDEIAALRALIEDVKGNDIDINAIVTDALNGSQFDGWRLDISSTEKGWAVRLRKGGQKQAIAISPNFSAAVAEAVIAARISDLST